MIEHEVIWESLRSMHRSEQKYRQKLLIDQFLISVLENLSKDLRHDPFHTLFDQIQTQLINTAVFILRLQDHDYASVFKSTILEEEGHMWPLIGPFRRSQQGTGTIIFNTKLIPVLRNFTPVNNHQIISIVTSGFNWGSERFILVVSRPEIGGFDHTDQELIHHLANLISTQEDRFKLGLNNQTVEINNFIRQSASHSMEDPDKTIIDEPLFIFEQPDSEPSYKHIAWLKISDKQIHDGYSLAERYQITKRLGQGGQAVVYQAFDQLIKRTVAIKLMMHQSIPKQQTFESAIREASLAANINHPNVVKIYDIGFISNGQQPFIVMEYLEGSDLNEVLKKSKALSVSRVLSLFIPVLDALGEAHRSGLVHRDLKPHNLLFSKIGKADELLKILDFGLAQFTEQENADSEDISGTLAYLAPEYLRDRIIGPQIDVYQIALIIIEAITGQQVFSCGAYYITLMNICAGEWIFPPALFDTRLGEILQKATALDPQCRYQDGLEFSEALSSVPPNDLKVVETRLNGSA